MDAKRSTARVLRTLGQLSRTGSDGTSPRNFDVVVRSPRNNGPVLNGGIVSLPTMGHSGSQDILNKQQSTSPRVSRNFQNFDASVDGNLPNDGDYTAIFSKVLDRELYDNLSTDIYLRCQMEFTCNSIRTEASDFVHLGLPAINASDEFNTIIAPAIRLIWPTYGSHWSAPDRVFGEATAVQMSGTRSEQNYSYKLIFKLGGEIGTLGAKIFQWVNHLWTWLLLVQKLPTERRHQLTRFLSEQKLQTPLHEHDKRSRQRHQPILQNKK